MGQYIMQMKQDNCVPSQISHISYNHVVSIFLHEVMIYVLIQKDR